MGYRFLILNTDYSEFFRWFYSEHLGQEKQPYEEQMRVRMESLFGLAAFCSSTLRKPRHGSYEAYADNDGGKDYFD